MGEGWGTGYKSNCYVSTLTIKTVEKSQANHLLEKLSQIHENISIQRI